MTHLGEKLQIVARREFERIQHAYRSISQHQAKPDLEVAITVNNDEVVNISDDFSLDQYEALSARYPDNDLILFNLGNKYLAANMVEQAAIAFRKATDLNPDNEAAAHNFNIANLMCQLAKK